MFVVWNKAQSFQGYIAWICVFEEKIKLKTTRKNVLSKIEKNPTN
jgi:hypothetical protein